METEKPWWMSKTVWASIISLLSITLGIAGVSVVGLDPSMTADLILQLIGAASSLFAIWSRFIADSKLTAM